jgi:hypothetical protein
MIKPVKSLSIFLFYSIIFFLFYNNSFSSTSIEITNLPPGVTIDTAEIDKMVDQLQHTIDKNGPFVANAFALANVLGYPIGKSYLGSFPSFEIGLAAGAGCTNMKYFDKSDPAHDNGTRPMFAPNPVIHFGVGIGGGVDVLGKMFYISKSVVNRYKSDIDYEAHGTTLKDYKIYSAGAKLRYNYIKEKKFLPFYLSFGGITFSLGGNILYGDISFTGNYKYDFENVTVDLPPTRTVPMHFDGQFDANIHWAIFTLDAQAIAYFDIFYLFSLYSGFGATGNIGSFKVKFNGNGTFTADNVSPPLPTNEMGNLTFTSKNSYGPSHVIPLYILGLEINILVLKLNVETMVNLLNRSDVSAQFGTRLQF